MLEIPKKKCPECGGRNFCPDPSGYGVVIVTDSKGRPWFCEDCQTKEVKNEKE